jgi:hypothetical protein
MGTRNRGRANAPLQCLIECDPKDGAAVIATAEQHFPDKVFEVTEAFRNPTKGLRVPISTL